MTCIYPPKKSNIDTKNVGVSNVYLLSNMAMLDFGGVIHWVKYHSVNMRAHGCSQDSSILRSA